jgi:hypothetical protein
MQSRHLAAVITEVALAAVSFGQPAARPANYYRMKLVKTVDQFGFDHPIPSAGMLIPNDWQFTGQTAWVKGNRCDPVQTAFKTSSPDGKLAIEGFPQFDWQWSDDPSVRQAAMANLQTQARYGSKGCDVLPLQTAAEFLRANYRKVRPNAQVVAAEPIPDVAEQMAGQARQAEAAAARYGLQQHIRTDVGRLRLRYSLNGQPVEEWVTAVIVVRATTGPSYNVAMGRMGQATYYNCSASQLFALRAPQGQLDASLKFFRMLLSTIRVDPAWQARVSQSMSNIAAIEQKGVRDRSDIVAKNNEDVSKIINDGWQQRQKVQDQTASNFSRVIRGVEEYRNPATGETIDLDNRYGHAWTGPRGEYVLSDDPNFDPNVAFKEKWTALQPVK